jgi:hypothetical protein
MKGQKIHYFQMNVNTPSTPIAIPSDHYDSVYDISTFISTPSLTRSRHFPIGDVSTSPIYLQSFMLDPSRDPQRGECATPTMAIGSHLPACSNGRDDEETKSVSLGSQDSTYSSEDESIGSIVNFIFDD